MDLPKVFNEFLEFKTEELCCGVFILTEQNKKILSKMDSLLMD
jgi:hypothetical protein